MPRKQRSAWALALLFFGSFRGVRADDAPARVATCEAASPGNAAVALFREIELGAYRIETLARDCRSALQPGAAFDAARHTAAWLEVLDEVDSIGETLRSLAAGQHILSAAQRTAWMDLDTDRSEILRNANETVRALGGSTIGVQSEQYLRTLLDTQDRSLRMARIVVALDHCGEVRMLPLTGTPSGISEQSISIEIPVWE